MSTRPAPTAARPKRKARPVAPVRPRRSRSRGRRRLRVVLAATVGALGAWLLTMACILLAWSSLAGPGSGRRVVLRAPAGPLADLGPELRAQGLLQSPLLFAWYTRVLQPSLSVRGGDHVLNDALSPRELALRLGDVRSRPAVRANLPEGFTIAQMGQRLEELEVCSARAFQESARDTKLLRALGIAADHAEGHLFPASYDWRVDSDASGVVTSLVREMQKRVARIQARHPRALEHLRQELGFGVHEVLTLASMIEKEAARPEERPLIASVFFNRLRDPSFSPRRMLQSDPTAVYGCLVAPFEAPSCADFRGRVTPAMLRDPLNRYNTYRHAGLPPGPIANPGEGAIEAVLAPARTDYLFFVRTAPGRHAFSRTFEEHARGVRALQGAPPTGP